MTTTLPTLLLPETKWQRRRKWLARRMKSRVRRLGLTYRQVGLHCNPPVSFYMVREVANGRKSSKNVAAAVERLWAEKVGREDGHAIS